MKPAFSFRRVGQEIRRLDPEVKPNDLAWKVAAILLSSLAVGLNADRIAQFTLLSYRFVREVAWRLRKMVFGLVENCKLSGLMRKRQHSFLA